MPSGVTRLCPPWVALMDLLISPELNWHRMFQWGSRITGLRLEFIPMKIGAGVTNRETFLCVIPAKAKAGTQGHSMMGLTIHESRITNHVTLN